MALIDVVETPNPRARRFMLDHAVQDQARGRSYRSGEDPAEGVVGAILDLDGVEAVLTLPSSITVTVSEASEWDSVLPAIKAILGAAG